MCIKCELQRLLSDETIDDSTKLKLLVTRIDPMITNALILDAHIHEMDKQNRFEMTPDDLAVLIPFCDQLMDRELVERGQRLVKALFGSDPNEVNTAQAAMEMQASKNHTKH